MDAPVSKRPRTVTVSVLLLSILLIAGQISAIVNPAPSKYQAALGKAFPFIQYINLAMVVATTLLAAFFIYSIFKGRNWARILYLVLFILITLASIPAYLGAFHVSPSDQILGVARSIVMLVAMVLLFTAPGSQWFRRGQT